MNFDLFEENKLLYSFTQTLHCFAEEKKIPKNNSPLNINLISDEKRFYIWCIWCIVSDVLQLTGVQANSGIKS